MVRDIADEESDRMTCCGSEMDPLASAERGPPNRVTVYRCENCARIDSRGQASGPGWVGARARFFLELREEAFQRAGLVAGPATAGLDLENHHVLFWPTGGDHLH